ncbi:DMT family transporter [Microterricola viridarii]|uniref:Probable blue pigment (Indigoidine) exporter n=1 Tax=Microterricola viridarii TaxID=412690 RepID=A0A1H1Z8Z6_9MICO|nr:EamA family transporter [Microterricola viridarii]SDT30130.1 probable blue pigment (indigoidine) exporter [Microterricola viridarii]
MEAKWRFVLLTAIAPIAWGTTYYVTHQFLPADSPLWGAAIRALPAGLVLLALRRRLPRGSWWWKSLVLGTLNMGAFFALVYVAAQLLPTSIAATIMATGPLMMMLLAWPLIAERPQRMPLIGAGLGIIGVCTMLFTGATTINLAGVLASLSAMALSSLGFVLTKRWGAGVDVLSLTSWQLLAGGLTLVPLALLVEGAPPVLDGTALLGFGYVSLIATALAYVVWFTGLAHLGAGTVGLIGLLNPVTGVLLGVALAGEVFSPQQVLGILITLTGIVLGQRAGATRQHAAPPRAPLFGERARP